MLHGILGALGGTNEVQYERDPQTGKLVATAVKSGPGQQWKRIIAGALTGAAAGAAQRGPGYMGRAAAAGFGAGADMVQKKDQIAYDRAKDSAEMEDKTTVRKAQVALYNQELAKSTWEMTRNQTEFQIGVAQNAANMESLLASDPKNESLGKYSSFADFLEQHGGNAQQIAQGNANMEYRVIPNVTKEGKLDGVQIYRVNPGWNNQKNTDPVKIDMGPVIGKDGEAKENWQTVPANGMTNADIATLQQATAKRWMDYHKEQDANKKADEQRKSAEKIAAGNNATSVKVANINANSRQAVAGIKSQMLTSPTRTMMETAPKVIQLVDRIEAQINGMKEELGPDSGRWNELWAGKIGAKDEKFFALKTNDKLLSTLLTRMHMGARGAVQVVKDFRDMIDEGKQDPDNMIAALEEVKKYANDVKAGPHGMGEGGGDGAPQTHVFSKSAWLNANPGGDVDAAVKAATEQQYQVTD